MVWQNLKKYLTVAIILMMSWALAWSWVAAINPGHSWTEIGDGRFIVTGPTTPRTYTFPDASATLLTTSSPVTMAQGGTGLTSANAAAGKVLVSDGASFSYKTALTGGLLLGTTSTQTMTGTGNIEVWNNYLTDNGMAAGDLVKSNGTKFVRFATTTALSYVKVNAAGTDLEWSVMSEVAGNSGELQYNSGGSSWGATSSLAISGNVLSLDNMLSLGTTTLPSVATTGTIKLFNRQIARREMLKLRASDSENYSVLQPSLFDNYFCWIRPSSSGLQSLGCPANTSGGSTNVNETTGSTYNWTFNTTASYLYSSSNNFIRGTVTGAQNGFFYFIRTTLPDASYSNSSGVRLIYGMTDQSTNLSCGSDNVNNNDMIAFNYSTALSSNWRIAADDGSASAPTYTDTGLGFATGTYDFYLYSPPYPDTSRVYWRMDYLTTSTSAEGSVSTQLPGASVFLYNVACADSINSVTRNFRIETMYAEVPR